MTGIISNFYLAMPWSEFGPGTGLGVCVKVLLAVGRWFPPGTPVSSTSKTDVHPDHRLDMTLVVADVLKPQETKPAFRSPANKMQVHA